MALTTETQRHRDYLISLNPNTTLFLFPCVLCVDFVSFVLFVVDFVLFRHSNGLD
jgi:hypothetical protein